MNALDIGKVNCAGCGDELVGERSALRLKLEGCKVPAHEQVGGRINGRPYCSRCLAVHTPPQKAATRDDDSPWAANAVRDMEDAG